MPTFGFTLTPESVVRVHDAILCLAKFNETVGLEARRNELILTALNSSKSAYASFTFEKDAFFKIYRFSRGSRAGQEPPSGEARFTCQLYNKALLSVFKGRMIDAREKDTSIERCEVSIHDRPEKTECRLVVKMVCKHGVIKTYKLTYESVEIVHALFDEKIAKNKWSIGAHVLRTFSEYFGPKTEQLDIYSEDGRVTFTSYTEKIMDGREILKQPLQTSIAIDTLDFEHFAVEEKLHIGISVKDFKAIITHAETLKTMISAMYSHPTRPLQLSYLAHGMHCQFTLMTIGEYRGGSVTPARVETRENSARPSSRQASGQASERGRSQLDATTMPPPMQPASRTFARDSTQRTARPSPPPPKASVDHESLFLPQDDEDERQWGEKNYDDDEDELGWDASADNDSFATGLRRSSDGHGNSSRPRQSDVDQDASARRIPPTQRVSEIRGLFDD